MWLISDYWLKISTSPLKILLKNQRKGNTYLMAKSPVLLAVSSPSDSRVYWVFFIPSFPTAATRRAEGRGWANCWGRNESAVSTIFLSYVVITATRFECLWSIRLHSRVGLFSAVDLSMHLGGTKCYGQWLTFLQWLYNFLAYIWR